MAEAIALTADAKKKKIVQDNRETWLKCGSERHGALV